MPPDTPDAQFHLLRHSISTRHEAEAEAVGAVGAPHTSDRFGDRLKAVISGTLGGDCARNEAIDAARRLWWLKSFGDREIEG